VKIKIDERISWRQAGQDEKASPFLEKQIIERDKFLL